MSFASFAPNAAKVLFQLGWVLAVLVFLATFYPVIIRGDGDMIVGALVSGIVTAINALIVPWIAAAVLWRIDQYLERLK